MTESQQAVLWPQLSDSENSKWKDSQSLFGSLVAPEEDFSQVHEVPCSSEGCPSVLRHRGPSVVLTEGQWLFSHGWELRVKGGEVTATCPGCRH